MCLYKKTPPYSISTTPYLRCYVASVHGLAFASHAFQLLLLLGLARLAACPLRDEKARQLSIVLSKDFSERATNDSMLYRCVMFALVAS